MAQRVNLNSKNKNRYIDWAINAGSLIFFCVCLVSPYYLARIGVNFADEPYQILIAQNLNNAPLSFLSSIIASWWGETFGWNILSMRYFAITIQLIPFIVACYVMWRSIRQTALSLMIDGVCIFLMNGMFNFTLMGWDAVSNAFICIVGLVMFLYCKKSSDLKLVLLAILTGLAICTRVPNLVIIPFLALSIGLIHYRHGWKSMVIREITYVGVSLTCTVLIIILCFKTIPNYIGVVRTNLISSHGVSELIMPWMGMIHFVLSYVLLFGLMFITIKYVIVKEWRRLGLAMVLMCWLYLYLKFICRYFALQQPLLIHEFMYAYFLFMIVYILMKYWQVGRIGHSPTSVSQENKLIMKEHRATIICLSVALLSLVPGIGSNCCIHKVQFLCFIPLVVACGFSVLRKSFQYQSILFVLMTIPTVCVYKWNSSFEDTGIGKARVSCDDVSMYQGLQTNAIKHQMLLELNSFVNDYQEGVPLFISDYGPSRFCLYYMKGLQPQYSPNNWDGYNSLMRIISVKPRSL